jgi:DNA-directed RNA polymerase subunit RPC12/RpoP
MKMDIMVGTAIKRKDFDTEKDYRKAYGKAWKDLNHSAFNSYQKVYQLNSYRLKKYGLAPDEFQELLESQDYKCAICGTDEPGKTSWNVDHDHKTNKVRGILCHRCNVGLGHFYDSVEALQEAVKYLIKNGNV